MSTIFQRSNSSNNTVLVLFGPTAVGKTELLLKLSQDSRLKKKPVIVSADSIQIYKKLNIGTAKPSQIEQLALPHKMIDILEPEEIFTVFDFVTLADKYTKEIIDNGNFPIVSGGTAFYIKAFLFGPPVTPTSDEKTRKTLQDELASFGPQKLMDELSACDKESAQRISINDHYRLIRALEVYRLTGNTLSSYQLNKELRSKWNFITIGLERPREELYNRINARVDKMIENGLPSEIEELKQIGYNSSTNALKGIGYREFFEENATLPEIIDKIKQNSRHYAKKQLTFMKSLSNVKWFSPNDYENITNCILSNL